MMSLKKIYARIICIACPEFTYWERLKFGFESVITFAPVAFALDFANMWIQDNKQFGFFLCCALVINLVVGIRFHLKMKTFVFKIFILKNAELAIIVCLVHAMLEMFRYTIGGNIAGDTFKILIQITALFMPISKAMKNIHILTKGKYPPPFMMNKLYNFEENGDLREFMNKKDSE